MYPIIPPPELIQQWIMAATEPSYVPIQAARWGADQELEACKQFMHDQDCFMSPALRMAELHNARRPRPSSLKEQALEQLRRVNAILQFQSTGGETSVIRRAIEQLPDAL